MNNSLINDTSLNENNIISESNKIAYNITFTDYLTIKSTQLSNIQTINISITEENKNK